MTNKNKHIGSDFDDFLKEEGIRDEVETVAIKRVITCQLQEAMKKRHMNKTTMARRMRTSRSALNRLFDPRNESITLHTLHRAASVLGKKLSVKIV